MRHERTPSERAEELSAPAALAALRAGREAAVVRWRTYVCGTSLHRSEPLHAELSEGAQPGRWLADDAPVPAQANRVGYDGDGHVVLARGELGLGVVEHLVTRDEDHEELVLVERAWGTSPPVVRVRRLLRDAAGRVVDVLDEQGAQERFEYDAAGRVVGHETRYEDEEGETEVWRKQVRWDAGGAVERVEGLREDGTPYVTWTAALHRQEEELPPLPETIAGAAAELAAAYAAAIEAAAAELPDPCVAVIRAVGRMPEPGAVLGDRCIDGFRRHVREPDAAIESALLAAHNGDDAVYLDPVAHAGPELQRTLRRYAQRVTWLDWFGGHEVSDSWRAVNEELEAGRERARRELHEALALLGGPGGAPLLTVLWDERKSWEATIEAAGAARVAQLRERLATRPARRARRTAPRGPIRTRADVHTALVAKGLDHVADAIAADARIGIALQFEAGSPPVGSAHAGGSRLGGVHELPAGVDWPLCDGRALTPLATIDCAGLPAEADDRDLLPADGTLLVFAALHEDEDGVPLLAHGPPEEGDSGVRILHVAPGAETRPVDPPADLLERAGHEHGLLHELAVRPRAIVTLRDRLNAAQHFGLGTGETRAYGELCEQLWRADRENAPGQLLGHPWPVQDDPRQDEQELLFELAWSSPLGFEYLDGGSVYLLAEPANLRAGRWERVAALGSGG